MTPKEIEKIIENNGGKVSSNISKNTNYLLMGDDPGSKKQKAEEKMRLVSLIFLLFMSFISKRFKVIIYNI